MRLWNAPLEARPRFNTSLPNRKKIAHLTVMT